MSEETLTNTKGTLQLIAEHLAIAVQPLKAAVSDIDSFRSFMYRLGWDVTSLPSSYGNLAVLVNDISVTLESFPQSPSIDQIIELLEQIRELYLAIKNLNEAPEGVDSQAFFSEIGERLFELLLIDYVSITLPSLYNALLMLGVIEMEYHEATPIRPAFIRSHLRTDKISSIISDPLSIPKLVYGWGTNNFNFSLFADHLLELLIGLGIPASIQRVHRSVSDAYQGEIEETSKAIETMVKIPFFETEIAETPVEIGIIVLELPEQGTKPPGIIIQPMIPQEGGNEYQISEELIFRVQAETDLATTFGILFRSNELGVRYPFQPDSPPPTAGISMALDYKPTVTTTRVILGSPASTRLQISGATLGFGGQFGGQPELRAELKLKDLAVVISAGDQDSFLGKLLNGRDLIIPIPLSVQWSSRTGLSFSGNAGFQILYSPHLSLGPIRIDEVQLGLHSSADQSQPASIALDIGASLGAKLQALSLSIEGIGMQFAIVFKEGNVGPLDIQVGFNPPKGIGLAIDSDFVSGGGYLFFDRDRGEYGGILNLRIKDISLTGIGILTTKRPDGHPGFSLLIIISSDFPPIQLGYGFTLNGVGGLLGLNRTVVIEVLKEGIKNRTLDSILFPQNPIENAPRIISDIKRVFPDAEGRFIFGPMAKLAWGTPSAIIADIGLALEVPEPIRLILLGKIRALLPAEKIPLIQLNMDVLGILDFEKSTVSVDASLYESRLLQYTLSGDMALRAAWGENPLFILSVGGLNPRFQPPPSFPTLSRLQVSLGVGNNPRLDLEAYLAITSNTVQFGALLELYAEAFGFNIKGHLGFDCLFQLLPFQFAADISGGVSFRRGSTTLASVNLKATLTGPRPWRAKGKAKISFFFFSASVPFDVEWGDISQVILPAIDVWSELRKALEDPRNWSAILPPMTSRSVSYRKTHEDIEGIVVVDPFGTLVLRQRVAPINRMLTKFGNSVPLSDSFFSITEVNAGNTKLARINKEHDLFAPAQFREMSDDEKLSVPEFERMQSGVSINSGIATTADKSSIKEAEMIYETHVLDLKGKRIVAPQFAIKMTSARAVAMAEFAALKKSRWWNTGEEKYLDNDILSGEHKSTAAVTFEEYEEFAIVNKSDMKRRDDVLISATALVQDSEEGEEQQQRQPLTKSKAYDIVNLYLSKHPQERGSLEVVPAYEASQVI